MEPKTIVMVAGEVSGDMHAANVIRALKSQDKTLFICGVGSRAMRAAGAKILIEADDLAVVGITEAIAKAPGLLKARTQLKQLLAGLKPSLLILIDFPDFNLHIAKIAKKLGIPILYYISPQIWAWRAGRAKKIKATVDHMAVILPFEKSFYQKYDIPATFVGHPLMDRLPTRTRVMDHKPLVPDRPVVGLLPGSRDREVSTLLPTMLQAGKLLQKELRNVQFSVSCAPSIDRAHIANLIAKHPLDNIEISNEPVSDLFAKCHLTIVASGTVTLEAALCATPMIITYAISPISYWLGRLLIKVEHIGLVNLIAEKRIVPELVQKEATPEKIFQQAHRILTDQQQYQQTYDDLLRVRDRLGQPGAAQKVAQIAMNLMTSEQFNK